MRIKEFLNRIGEDYLGSGTVHYMCIDDELLDIINRCKRCNNLNLFLKDLGLIEE